MNRSLALRSLALLVVAWPAAVAADAMDPALSRLRIAGAAGDCPAEPGRYCPDNELFERLVGELSVAMAAPLNHPARGVGPRGFHLALDTTVTTLGADQVQWQRGSEGEEPEPRDLANPSPAWVMVWNRAQARKGLPFGFEVGSSLGQAVDTSLWSFGLHARWALFEGFHSELGKLPDVALGAGYQRSLGSHQLDLELITLELVLSKPYVIERSVRLSPLLGAQLLVVEADSGVVDLTPGERGDPINHVSFDAVSQQRLRLSGGARARYDFVTFGLVVMLDLTTPAVQARVRDAARGQDVLRQLAFNLSLGAVL